MDLNILAEISWFHQPVRDDTFKFARGHGYGPSHNIFLEYLILLHHLFRDLPATGYDWDNYDFIVGY